VGRKEIRMGGDRHRSINMEEKRNYHVSERVMFNIAWCLEIGFARVSWDLVWRYYICHEKRNIYGVFC